MAWRIGEILVQKKLITWDQLKEVLEEQQRTRELTGEILIRKGYVSRLLVYKALAEQYHIHFVDLKKIHINPQAVEKIPADLARKYALMPVEVHKEVLTVAISNPVHAWPEDELKQISKMTQIRTVLCMPEDIEEAIQQYYGAAKQPNRS